VRSARRFVPALQDDGYAAVGVEPQAPEESGYQRIGFEDYRAPQPVHAVVACTSLHHVADLDRCAGTWWAAGRGGVGAEREAGS
jgi:hypothetical protein